MKARLYSSLKFAVGWPLTILAFIFIGKIIYDQAHQILPDVKDLNAWLLFYGSISLLIYYVLRSLVWYRVLKNFGYSIPFKESNYLWVASEAKRYVPGKVWTFLGRAVVFNKKGVEKKDVIKGMLIEAEFFVIGCTIVSLLAMPYLLPGYNSLIGWGLSILVAAGLLVYIFGHILIKKHTAKKSDNAKQTKSLFGTLRSEGVDILVSPFKPRQTLTMIAISVSALFFFGLGNYFIVSSLFYLDVQLVFKLIGVFVFAFLVGFLSIITPAGFGVREGILIFALNKLIGTGAGAFASLFSRLIQILTEVIYIGISFIWLKLRIPAIKRIEKWVVAHPHEVLVISLALVYTIYFSTVSMLRYDHFFAGKFDLGNMAHTVWNTANGNIFMLTDPNGTREVSRLAFHADFILIFLAPFYWIWPDPRMILLIQTVVVAAGAYFVYLITQKVLNHQLLGVVLAFAYLINPSVQRVNIYDFHAPALATTFLLGTFYFYIKKQYVWFIVFALLAAFCKEQIWAILAIFGIFLMIHHKKFIFGALMFFISAGMFYYLVSYAIPQTLGSDHFALEYYSEFGSSPAEVIKTFILSPDKVLTLLMEEEHIKYLKQLFWPLGYLSFFAPWMLIFAGPDLMINLMSSNPQLHYIYYQYTAAITPFIFIAAIYGIWVLRWASLRAIESSRELSSPLAAQLKKYLHTLRSGGMAVLILYILYQSIYTAYLYGPLPGSKEPNTDVFTKHESDREFIDKTLAAIPPDKKVAASNNIGAHLTNRRDIYVLPVGAKEADVLVFFLTKSEQGSSFAPQVELLETLSKDPRYREVVQKDEFTVIEKK